MFISRKKFEQEIEKAKTEVREERNRHEELANIWRAIRRLDEIVHELKGHDHDKELHAYDNQRSQ